MGHKVTYDSGQLYVIQPKYDHDILVRFILLNSKPLIGLYVLKHTVLLMSAKKQPIVSTSSNESEYCDMENTNVEIVWITYILCELHVRPHD
uniref:Uncharacterized protein n=1 Tax=Lactuca sativa TaxID=4236 RepID=A0A9R1WMS4_LACSA|nr:hypothetical protein LSAT_V11C100003380 [Lactuca sativa]